MFKQALENILERTEGSLGAFIMGTDGIAVEQSITPAGRDANLDVAAMEVTTLVRHMQRTGDNLDFDSLGEMALVFGKATLLARSLNRNYFIGLVLEPESNIGRARFELRKAEFDLAREFVV